MPSGPGTREIWLLGSSDQGARVAAHLGLGFSFAHFINDEGGVDATRAYARDFRPSELLPTPRASVAVFTVCAATEAEALRLAKSRDLFVARLYTGRRGRYPSADQADTHAYTAHY